MNKIRILCVDDSALIRRMLTDCLKTDAEIEIVGTAANGILGVKAVGQYQPEIVIMDVEMPEMDGIQAVREIRKTHPKLPIIMFSTLTSLGAGATIDALAAGATDYCSKPSNTGSLEKSVAVVRAELIPKIKMLVTIYRKTMGLASPTTDPKSAASAPPKNYKLESPAAGPVVAASPAPKPSLISGPSKIFKRMAAAPRVEALLIGVSTGGPNALASIFPQIPKEFPVPILIVQHMPPLFTKMLAERLAAASKIPVVEAAPGAVLKPGVAWIAPGDYHMALERRDGNVYIQTNQNAPENSCRPAVDPLFRSGVEIYGANCLAVVLTGMGQDGLLGARRVREAGGQVVAQDEASSVVWGMPGAVAQDGIAEAVVSLQEMPAEILRRVSQGRSMPAASPKVGG